MFIDRFSGLAADLPKGKRTDEHVLAALAKSPWLSTWDLSENAWLWRTVKDLMERGLVEEKKEPYPWHKFVLTDLGREFLS